MIALPHPGARLNTAKAIALAEELLSFMKTPGWKVYRPKDGDPLPELERGLTGGAWLRLASERTKKSAAFSFQCHLMLHREATPYLSVGSVSDPNDLMILLATRIKSHNDTRLLAFLPQILGETDPKNSGVVTPEDFNLLPASVKAYIRDLETRADPSGDVQQIASLTEQVKGLTARLQTQKRQELVTLTAAALTGLIAKPSTERQYEDTLAAQAASIAHKTLGYI